MKRKILTLLLALAMVLTMLPMTALAAEGDVAEVNGQGYQTLQAAINAAKDGGTVKLLKESNEDVAINQQIILTAADDVVFKGTLTFNTGSKDSKVVKMTFDYSGANANIITINSGATGVTVGGCNFNLHKLSGLDQPNCIRIRNASGASIVRNQFHLARTAGRTAVAINLSGEGTNNTTVSENSFDVLTDGDLSGSLLFLKAMGETKPVDAAVVNYITGLRITNNTIDGFGAPEAVSFAGLSGVQNPVITGNQVTNYTNGIFRVIWTDEDNNKWGAKNDFENALISGNTFSKMYGAVAEIAGAEYKTIAAAVNAAQPGDTVKLLKNVAEDVTIPAEKEITLDLNGKMLTNASNHTIINNGTLTIKDSGENGCVDNMTHQKAALYNKGTATLEAATFERSQEAGIDAYHNGGNSFYTVLNHGRMTVKAGVTVLNSGKFSSLFENGYSNWEHQDGIANPSLTIDGGTFGGGLNTIKNDDNALLTVNDGLFTNYAQAAFQNHHVATVNGGTFVGSEGAKAVINCGVKDCPVNEHDLHSLTILNGKFTGAFVSNSDASIVIYAGYFTSEPDAAYLAPGKVVYLSNLAGYDYMVAAKESVTPVTPSEPAQLPFNPDAGKGSTKFDDVSDNAWYASAVNYAVDKGLMNGTGDNKFSPEADTTRGMIVTILARLDGKNTSGTPWYQAGQRWAMEYEISDGTNMTAAITREQLVTMLYRYAVKNGLEAVTLAENLSQFTDASSVSAWAVPAMQWAVGQGLIQGSNGQLRPQANASRAEVATILMRFCELLNK